MNRRDLLKLIPAMTTAAVIPTIAEAKEENDNWGTYKGFFYYWCGWQPSNNQGLMVGHWISRQSDNPTGWQVYSSYPGATMAYFSDQLFDTSIRKDQQIPTPDMPIEKLDEFKNEALAKLKRYIDKNRKTLIGELGSENYHLLYESGA